MSRFDAGFGAAFAAELLKARRSKVPWLAALGMSLAPVVGALFMVIIRDPARARSLGLIGQKAQITAGAVADWPAFLGLLGQSVAVGGWVVFALVTSWIFGREFADHTAKDLLAVPTPREVIVAAKFAVLALWAAGLTLWILVLGAALGAVVGLPGFSWALLWRGAGDLALVSSLTLVLVTPVAWIATLGRGYLPPLGFALLALFGAQVSAVLGWGAWFPWSVPALFSGVAGPRVEYLAAGSYLLVTITGLIGLAATVGQWRWADQPI